MGRKNPQHYGLEEEHIRQKERPCEVLRPEDLNILKSLKKKLLHPKHCQPEAKKGKMKSGYNQTLLGLRGLCEESGFYLNMI